jgi:hypothetical protein
LTDLATPRTTGRADTVEVPQLIESAPAPTEGVELSRLLALARLTPQQAVVIAAAVLAEAGEPVGRPALAAQLEEIAAAARYPGRRADPAGDRLLAALDRAVADLPAVGVATVALRLEEAAGSVDRDAVRAELTALVRAMPAGVRGPAGAPSPQVRRAPSERRGLSGETGNPGRRVAAWLLSVLVLAAVVLVEVVVLRGKISTDIGLLLDAGRGGEAAATAPAPEGRPTRAPAPAAAGTVTAVDLRPLARCTPNAPCTLRLLVRLSPRADPQVVTWSYLVVDRCTGTTVSAPGGTVPAAPDGEDVVAVGTVVLPDLPSVAVVAVTASPAVAASSPVTVGSCGGTD